MKKLLFFVVAIGFLAFGTKVWAASAASDAEALSLIKTVNQNEIKAAETATSKNVDSQVKNYAEMLNKEHRTNLEKTAKLEEKIGAQAEEATSVKQVKDQGEQDMAMLADLDGPEFSKAYITAMVKGHTQAIDMLDQIKPDIQDKQVQKHVAQTRDHIAMHLKKAKEIQSDLDTRS